MFEGDVRLLKLFRQTVPQCWPGSGKTAVIELVAKYSIQVTKGLYFLPVCMRVCVSRPTWYTSVPSILHACVTIQTCVMRLRRTKPKNETVRAAYSTMVRDVYKRLKKSARYVQWHKLDEHYYCRFRFLWFNAVSHFLCLCWLPNGPVVMRGF